MKEMGNCESFKARTKGGVTNAKRKFIASFFAFFQIFCSLFFRHQKPMVTFLSSAFGAPRTYSRYTRLVLSKYVLVGFFDRQDGRFFCSKFMRKLFLSSVVDHVKPLCNVLCFFETVRKRTFLLHPHMICILHKKCPSTIFFPKYGEAVNIFPLLFFFISSVFGNQGPPNK